MAAPKANNIDISIMGRDYHVACTEDERPGLMAAVDYLNGKLESIRTAGKIVGGEKIAVMAALNIAHEFLSTKLAGGASLGDVKSRLTGMQAQIDEAIAAQEKLF